MKKLLAIAVLLLGGCAAPAVRTGGPQSREEREIVRILPEFLRTRVRFTGWGPHDTDGSFAAEVKVRRDRGQEYFQSELAQTVEPGDQILRVQYETFRKGRRASSVLFVFRTGAVVRFGKKPYYATASFQGNPQGPNWYAQELGLLRMTSD